MMILDLILEPTKNQIETIQEGIENIGNNSNNSLTIEMIIIFIIILAVIILSLYIIKKKV